MKKKGRRQPFYPAPPFCKTFVPKSHVFKNSLPRASLFHRLFSDQESGNACRAFCIDARTATADLLGECAEPISPLVARHRLLCCSSLPTARSASQGLRPPLAYCYETVECAQHYDQNVKDEDRGLTKTGGRAIKRLLWDAMDGMMRVSSADCSCIAKHP